MIVSFEGQQQIQNLYHTFRTVLNTTHKLIKVFFRQERVDDMLLKQLEKISFQIKISHFPQILRLLDQNQVIRIFSKVRACINTMKLWWINQTLLAQLRDLLIRQVKFQLGRIYSLLKFNLFTGIQKLLHDYQVLEEVGFREEQELRRILNFKINEKDSNLSTEQCSRNIFVTQPVLEPSFLVKSKSLRHFDIKDEKTCKPHVSLHKNFPRKLHKKTIQKHHNWKPLAVKVRNYSPCIDSTYQKKIPAKRKSLMILNKVSIKFDKQNAFVPSNKQPIIHHRSSGHLLRYM